jgi:hypothetical protein
MNESNGRNRQIYVFSGSGAKSCKAKTETTTTPTLVATGNKKNILRILFALRAHHTHSLVYIISHDEIER